MSVENLPDATFESLLDRYSFTKRINPSFPETRQPSSTSPRWRLVRDLDPQPLNALKHAAVRRGNVAVDEHMGAAEVETAQRRQQQPARSRGQLQAGQGRHQDGVAPVYGLDGALAPPEHFGRGRRGLRVVLDKHLHEEPVAACFLKSAALPAGAIPVGGGPPVAQDPPPAPRLEECARLPGAKLVVARRRPAVPEEVDPARQQPRTRGQHGGGATMPRVGRAVEGRGNPGRVTAMNRG